MLVPSIDIMMSLLLAAYETTAITMVCACYWLAALPHVQSNIFQEVSRVGATNIGELHYTKAFRCTPQVITQLEFQATRSSLRVELWDISHDSNLFYATQPRIFPAARGLTAGALGVPSTTWNVEERNEKDRCGPDVRT